MGLTTVVGYGRGYSTSSRAPMPVTGNDYRSTYKRWHRQTRANSAGLIFLWKSNRACEGGAMAHPSSSSFHRNESCCVADNAHPAEVVVILTGQMDQATAGDVPSLMHLLLATTYPREMFTPICARIEALVKDFLRSLVSTDPSISSLPLVCRTTKNTRIQKDLLGNGSSILLMCSTFSRQLTSKNGVKSFIRVWKVLEICYQLLQSRKRVTQRELFYRLLSDPSSCTRNPRQVNDAIQDVVALLRCTRDSLGIFASGKGLLVGRLLIQEPDGRRTDCTKLGANHYNISGDISCVERLAFHSDARYIIVVEKETVFQRLARDRFYQVVPSIIITGKGYPDLATRVILHRLHQAFPTLPIFALIDWNPAGLAILCTYKFGSMRMGLETPHHVCDVKWLGMRHEDLKHVSYEAMLDLKGRDKILAQSLLVSKMLQNHKKHRYELGQMIQRGKRVELEALHANGDWFLGKFIADKIVQQDYI